MNTLAAARCSNTGKAIFQNPQPYYKSHNPKNQFSNNAHNVKELINPVDFYRHELPEAQFKRHGWNNGGICPFHADNQPGSFRINTESGAFTCFACGTKGGDIIAFTMAQHGLNFVDSLAKLSDDWSIV